MAVKDAYVNQGQIISESVVPSKPVMRHKTLFKIVPTEDCDSGNDTASSSNLTPVPLVGDKKIYIVLTPAIYVFLAFLTLNFSQIYIFGFYI